MALTGLGLARGLELDEVLEVSIALAVAIVPEGLPADATLTLTVGMRRMARQNALVRRLPVVETLGSTTVIASDKTGTLTRNEMTVAALTMAEGVDAADLWLAAVVCNDSDIALDGDPVGDPTEVAVLHGAADAGFDWRELRDDHARVDEVPFDSATKHMAVATADTICLKGAPEVIIQPGVPGAEALLAAVEEMSAKALRTRALARKRGDGTVDPETAFADTETLGVVGLADPARPDAIAAVEECRRAGIRVVIVTGDQPRTAAAIGEQFGMRTDPVVTGLELDAMSPAQLIDTVRHTPTRSPASTPKTSCRSSKRCRPTGRSSLSPVTA